MRKNLCELAFDTLPHVLVSKLQKNGQNEIVEV